jgi:vancomycin permeability regulator SanA
MLKKIVKTIIITIITAVAAAIAFIGYANYQVARASRGFIVDAADAPRSQAALVLGASVYRSGRLSPIFEDRIRTAIALYASGTVEKILVSGDHGRLEYDEVDAAKKMLLNERVPAEDIFLDYAGFDTFDSMYRARDVFGASDIIVVTQAYHLPRAIYLARSLGLNAYGVPSDRQSYQKIEYYQLREAAANVKAFLDILRGAKPKFLGDKIPIVGDGRGSWDKGF